MQIIRSADLRLVEPSLSLSRKNGAWFDYMLLIETCFCYNKGAFGPGMVSKVRMSIHPRTVVWADIKNADKRSVPGKGRPGSP